MENDDFFMTKKSGMTITKAWMLFISMFLIYFLIGGVFGFIQASRGEKLDPASFIGNTLILNGTVSFLMCVIAYFVNIREFPRFEKITPKAAFVALFVGVALRFSLSIVEEIPFSMVTAESMKEITSLNPLFLFLPVLILMIFQVGFIGHGLLRNYGFGTALVTTVLVSIINFELKSIISIMLLSGVGLLVYYRTSSFLLYLILIFPYFIADYFLTIFFDFDLFGFNNFRYVLIKDDTVYFVLLTVSILSVLASIRYYVSLKPIQWKREDELPEF